MNTTDTPTTRPLAERITQGPALIAQEIALEGVWVEGGSPDEPDEICHCVESSISRDEANANAKLIAEAFNVTHETGRTPRQLADERAELIAALLGMLDAYAPHRDASKLDAMQSDVRRAVELLTRLNP
jgi:hypothetical protein